MYRERTKDIEVAVQPEYLEDQSDPDQHRFIWAYTVIIANHSPETVQLESRYWHITNAIGQVEEVSGPGVVGEQPVLEPGETYQYTSGCPLNTPSGTMAGHYVMRAKDGQTFEVRIPPFSLDLPDQTRIIH